MPNTVDTSSYQDYANQPSAVDTISKFANLQGQLNQNKLFQQQFDSRNAMGAIFQQANGDPDKAQALAQQNPATSYLAPQIAKEMADYKSSMAQAQISSLSAQQKGYEQLAGVIKAHQLAGDHSDAAVTNLAAETLGNPDIRNTVGPKRIIDELTALPPYKEGVSDPMLQPRYHALNAILGGAYAQSGHLADVIGKMQLVDTGGGIQPTQVSDVTGTATPVGAPISKTLPPTTQQFDPNKGQMVYVGGTSGGQGGQGHGGAPGAGAPGTVAAAPPLGTEAATNVTATGAAGQGLALQQRADQVPQTKALLGNLESSLNNFTSGPGADWKKVASSAVNANSPFGDIFDPKKIASQEEFGKQAFQLAQQQFQTLGGTGTDSKLDSTMHTSPSEMMSELGNQNIIHLLKGNEDAIQAKNAAWQQWTQTHGSQTYGQFSQQFNNNFDPRVFQAQYMSKSDKQEIFKGMTSDEVDALKAKTRYAIDQGWIKKPGQPAQQGAQGGQ